MKHGLKRGACIKVISNDSNHLMKIKNKVSNFIKNYVLSLTFNS